MQPLPEDAKRCPNCRTLRPSDRTLPILLGVASLLALIFLVYVMIEAMHTEEKDNLTTQSEQDQRPPLNK